MTETIQVKKASTQDTLLIFKYRRLELSDLPTAPVPWSFERNNLVEAMDSLNFKANKQAIYEMSRVYEMPCDVRDNYDNSERNLTERLASRDMQESYNKFVLSSALDIIKASKVVPMSKELLLSLNTWMGNNSDITVQYYNKDITIRIYLRNNKTPLSKFFMGTDFLDKYYSCEDDIIKFNIHPVKAYKTFDIEDDLLYIEALEQILMYYGPLQIIDYTNILALKGDIVDECFRLCPEVKDQVLNEDYKLSILISTKFEWDVNENPVL